MAPVTRAAKRRALQCQEAPEAPDAEDPNTKNSTDVDVDVDVKSRSHVHISSLYDKRVAPPPCAQTKLYQEASTQDGRNEQRHSVSRLVLPPLRPIIHERNVYGPSPLDATQTVLTEHDISPGDTSASNQASLKHMAQEALMYLENEVSKTPSAT